MGEMKHYTGKLKEVYPDSKETFEEMCHRILLQENVIGKDEIAVDYYYSEWSEVLEALLYGKYVIVVDEDYKKHLLKVLKKKEILSGSDVYHLHQNTNGEYEYEIVYYNGGTCFGDAINYAYETMNMEDKEWSYIVKEI